MPARAAGSVSMRSYGHCDGVSPALMATSNERTETKTNNALEDGPVSQSWRSSGGRAVDGDLDAHMRWLFVGADQRAVADVVVRLVLMTA